MKEQILEAILAALDKLGIQVTQEQKAKINVTTPDPKLGDFATNASLILAKEAKTNPLDLAHKLAAEIPNKFFRKIEVAAPGFINFTLSTEQLLNILSANKSKFPTNKDKVLLEYFQPNIAKPLHIGHLRTAVIGDSLKRMMHYVGIPVESDTHMGDWGTQFGFLILACKTLDRVGHTEISEEDLNAEYVRLNAAAEKDPSIHEQAKAEFVKLEKGDKQSREAWQQIVDKSVQKFLDFASEFDLLPFDHHWPESFYEDKMPAVVEELRKKRLLVESQGAQIVDMQSTGLGVAIIVKSDGSTTYLLRDLAGFLFAKKQGFARHLYVVDNRQSHHYQQLFAILKMMNEFKDGEGVHIDYGFISFKGQALSTRKGNMVLAHDVVAEARKRVAKIIKEKNPDLADKEKVIHAVAIGSLKYYDLSHNRRSDFEFDWDEALDFEGNSGPYLQYAYARLSGILNKVNLQGSHDLSQVVISATERQIILKLSALDEVVAESLKDYLPNLLANYLFELASLINKFYHESQVAKESDEKLKFLRLTIIRQARSVLGTGLSLLGIEALEEM